jgi:hypothetical protein
MELMVALPVAETEATPERTPNVIFISLSTNLFFVAIVNIVPDYLVKVVLLVH